MSDTDTGGVVSRVSPSRARTRLADLTLIVRPPGNPAATRAFTATELAEAESYAREAGGEVEHLS